MIQWLLATRLGRVLAGALAGVLALLGIWYAGKREGRQDAAQKADKDYIDTRKRIDHAEKPSDPDAARAWLADRMRDRKR